MAESESKTAAAGRTNSVTPDPAAAAVPCECAERFTTLEGRMSAYETLNRAMSWCMLAAAAAVIYILWTGGATPGGDGKK